eukprot:1159621-Pelagomonas_calceolata.AAC.3
MASIISCVTNGSASSTDSRGGSVVLLLTARGPADELGGCATCAGPPDCASSASSLPALPAALAAAPIRD